MQSHRGIRSAESYSCLHRHIFVFTTLGDFILTVKLTKTNISLLKFSLAKINISLLNFSLTKIKITLLIFSLKNKYQFLNIFFPLAKIVYQNFHRNLFFLFFFFQKSIEHVSYVLVQYKESNLIFFHADKPIKKNEAYFCLYIHRSPQVQPP